MTMVAGLSPFLEKSSLDGWVQSKMVSHDKGEAIMWAGNEV
jgi:hypothetical protein